MRDNANDFSAVNVVSPQVLTATNTSAALDLVGYDGSTVVITTGAIAGAGDFTAKLTECATSGGVYTDVIAADLIGSFPASLIADSVVKVGYKGSKRFLKTVLTRNSGTSIAGAVTLIKGHPGSRPAA